MLARIRAIAAASLASGGAAARLASLGALLIWWALIRILVREQADAYDYGDRR